MRLIPARPIPALLIVASLLGCDDGEAPTLQIVDAAGILDAALIDQGAPPADLGPVDQHVVDAMPPPAARDYCEATVDLFCPFYLRCGRMAVADVATCRAVFLENCNAVYEPVYAALADAGLLALDPAGIAACADHLAQVECSAQIFDLDGPCGRMWVGQAAEGAACGPGIESFVCAPGSTCVISLDFCGECAPTVPVDGDCAEGRCGPEARCVEGVCAARALPGEPCGETGCVLGARCVDGTCAGPARAAAGGSCAAGERCPYKAECVGGVCVEAGLIGAACDAARPCASGACVDGACAAPAAAGAPCEGGAQCLGGACAAGACAPIPGGCFR